MICVGFPRRLCDCCRDGGVIFVVDFFSVGVERCGKIAGHSFGEESAEVICVDNLGEALGECLFWKKVDGEVVFSSKQGTSGVVEIALGEGIVGWMGFPGCLSEIDGKALHGHREYEVREVFCRMRDKAIAHGVDCTLGNAGLRVDAADLRFDVDLVYVTVGDGGLIGRAPPPARLEKEDGRLVEVSLFIVGDIGEDIQCAVRYICHVVVEAEGKGDGAIYLTAWDAPIISEKFMVGYLLDHERTRARVVGLNV